MPVPYEEFSEAGETYYFTPGGFLYRKDFLTEQLGGYFCGYLTDEVWHYRKMPTLSKSLSSQHELGLLIEGSSSFVLPTSRRGLYS